MKIKGRAGCILLALTASMLMMVGCYSKETRMQIAEYTKQGKENALVYIEEKYGFEAEVLSVDWEHIERAPIPDFAPTPNGIVYVQMKYEDNEFYVKIRGDRMTTNGYDNYQAEEIRDAFAEQMEEITGLHAEQIKLLYGEERTYNPESKYYGLVSTYFNGDNFYDIFENSNNSYDNRVVVSVIRQDISSLPYEKIQETFGESAVYLFANYRSEQDYAHMGDDQIRAIWGFPVTNNVDKYALFIEDYVQLEKNEVDYKKYTVKKHDDIYYVLKNGTYAEFKKTLMGNANYWRGYGAANCRQVHEAYEIDTDASSIHIWIAYEDIGYTAEDDIKLGLQYMDDGREVHAIGLTSDDIGQDQYLYYIIYMRDYSDMKFSVFLDEGRTRL